MAIGSQDILTFFVKELHEHCIFIIEVTPERKFWLQDDTVFIGCCEGGLWRTPGVETHMVQTVGLTSAEIRSPGVDIHRHVSCQGPHTGIVSATQKYLVTIGIEMLPLDVEVLEVGMYLLGSLCYAQFGRKFDFTDDAIPVGLGILRIGMTVGIDLFWHTTSVIHHDSQLVLAWFYRFREIEHLRGGDVIR